MKITLLKKLIKQLAENENRLRLPDEIRDDRWRDTGVLDSEGRMIQVSVASDHEVTIRAKRHLEYRSVPYPAKRYKKAAAKKVASVRKKTARKSTAKKVAPKRKRSAAKSTAKK